MGKRQHGRGSRPQQTHNQQRGDQQRYAPAVSTDVALPETKSKQEYAEQTATDSPDDRENKSSLDQAMVRWTAAIGRWTRGVAVFTLLLFGATCDLGLVAYWQYQALNNTDVKIGRQLDEMQAARRPWLKVEAGIAGPLTFKPVPKVAIKTTLTNVGQSPAIEAWAYAVMFPLREHGDAVKEMHRRCDEQREIALKSQRQNPRPLGYILFPNNSSERTSDVLFAIDGLERWKEEVSRLNFTALNIAICGDYRFSFSPDPHYTRILYGLGTNIRYQQGVNMIIVDEDNTNAAIHPFDGDIRKENLRLHQDPFGGAYAN